MRNDRGQFVEGVAPHNKKDDVDHGDWLMYNRGCRCQPCKTAFTEYQAELQGRLTVAQRRELPCSVCGEGEKMPGKSKCKDCYNDESRRRMNAKNRPEDYDERVVAQNGLCMICQKPETAVRNGRVKELAADHHHDSGIWRDLLCQRCNTGIGNFFDDPELLEAAAAYLRRHNVVCQTS